MRGSPESPQCRLVEFEDLKSRRTGSISALFGKMLSSQNGCLLGGLERGVVVVVYETHELAFFFFFFGWWVCSVLMEKK